MHPCLQGAMTQARRALKPDGLFLAAMWGGNTLQARLLSVTSKHQTWKPLAPPKGQSVRLSLACRSCG